MKLLALLLATSPVLAADLPNRTVAVTFDDLPGVALVSNEIPGLRENTRKLLAAFREHGVPVVGFVNENKLEAPGESAEDRRARTVILASWLEAGLDLGNHSYSHPDLGTMPLEEFEADVVRGEPVARGLLLARGRKLRYFRHPFLHVGQELEKRRAFEAFLAGRGYEVAPVTIDNDEYIYASVYADAVRRGDQATAAKIAVDYLRYMETVFAFFEDVSTRLLGREISQVLLLHANTLNADHFGRLAGIMKARGYRFVTLEKALEDEVYRRSDTYVGGNGISWLHHWEITEGKRRTPSPDPPDWVLKAYEARSK